MMPYEPDNLERFHAGDRGLPDEDWERGLLPRGEGDELVRRLRNLEWPRVSAEVRDRCWEQLTARVEELDGHVEEPNSDVQGDRNPFWHNEFTPRRSPVSGGGALRERVATARTLGRPLRSGHLPARRTVALAAR
jgi:hypothetical protein